MEIKRRGVHEVIKTTDYKAILESPETLNKYIMFIYYNNFDWYNSVIWLEVKKQFTILRTLKDWRIFFDQYDVYNDETRIIELQSDTQPWRYLVPRIHNENVRMKNDGDELYDIHQFNNISLSKYNDSIMSLSELYQVISSTKELDQWQCIQYRYRQKIGYVESLIEEYLQLVLSEMTYNLHGHFFKEVLLYYIGLTKLFDKAEEETIHSYSYRSQGDDIRVYIALIDVLNLFPRYIDVIYHESVNRKKYLERIQTRSNQNTEDLSLPKVKKVANEKYQMAINTWNISS